MQNAFLQQHQQHPPQQQLAQHFPQLHQPPPPLPQGYPQQQQPQFGTMPPQFGPGPGPYGHAPVYQGPPMPFAGPPPNQNTQPTLPQAYPSSPAQPGPYMLTGQPQQQYGNSQNSDAGTPPIQFGRATFFATPPGTASPPVRANGLPVTVPQRSSRSGNGNGGGGNGNAMGPRMGSRRATSSSTSGSTGARTPADETASVASSVASSSSSSSRKTFTSTASSTAHPLPARPDWAIGMKPSTPPHGRTRPPKPPHLQSSDFPPLSGVGGQQGQTQQQPQGRAAAWPARPPAKGVPELYNPRSGVKSPAASGVLTSSSESAAPSGASSAAPSPPPPKNADMLAPLQTSSPEGDSGACGDV
ncbi:hypothetical protein BKA62DRAFT_703111 [Auriculariales sp. MPI-PUGE-AT-0066]|nr:hypothetical protein BKA62DRAFT_703111 [Auriculariales sp. MPI-PUGE-AT-0066]